MASPIRLNKYLIVAHYQEKLDWLSLVPNDWQQVVITKGKEMPNEGREAGSYLFALLQLYDNIQDDDLIMCLQGDPTPHTSLTTLSQAWTSNFNEFNWLGSEHTTDGSGCPDHPGLPIAQMYRDFTGRTLTKKLRFASGAQFILPGRLVKSRPKSVYEMLFDTIGKGQMPWAMERLWEALFCE